MRQSQVLLRVSLVLAGLGLAFAVASCSRLLPREKWSERWGTMVPHHTFPGDCDLCHVPDNWEDIRSDFTFDHHQETGVMLRGAHAMAACLRCHNDRGPVEGYWSRGCGGCHVDPHRGDLGLSCIDCHQESTWRAFGLVADHAQTRFPLIASHALVPCEDCHPQAEAGRFRNAEAECHFCHQREVAAASPNHVINGWVTGCEVCHAPSNWLAVGFQHNGFPLVAGHAGLDCEQCHPGGLFTPISTDCFDCHQNDYVAAPNHVANNFSTQCLDCHNTTAWEETN